MKYFGIIKKEEIENFSIDEIENYLGENEIYDNGLSDEILSKLINVNFALDFNDVETKFYPSLNLINEFCEFIYKTYCKYVLDIKYSYFFDFYEEFYGYEDSDLRKIALSDFNEMFEKLNIIHVTLIDERISTDNISHTYTTGKLFKLYFHQQNIKKQMATTENLVSYLIGELPFYNKEFYDQNIEIRNAVHLEIVKQILVEINDKYDFEEDIYYSKKVSDALKFKDYNNIFKTLQAYQFTNKIISSFKKLKRTYIESLYQVLLEFDLIENHKENFIAFIKEEYKFILPKITTFSPKQNIQNDKRVSLLIKEWKENDVKKTNLDMFLNI